jgi:hypothetical protein
MGPIDITGEPGPWGPVMKEGEEKSMNRYSPYYDHDERFCRMSLDDNGSWVHIAYVTKLQEQIERLKEAADRIIELEEENAKILIGAYGLREQQQQEIERLRREMRRHLEILERAERDRFLWDRLATGTGVATLNGYRAALEAKS